jgi:DNA-binding SARP family transcriptional activator
MQAEAARGDRAAAILAYRRCADMLRDELGTEPSPETEAANREITTS